MSDSRVSGKRTASSVISSKMDSGNRSRSGSSTNLKDSSKSKTSSQQDADKESAVTENSKLIETTTNEVSFEIVIEII